MSQDPQRELKVDSLLPKEMAKRAEGIGELKVQLPFSKLFALAILAGAFIGLGAHFSTVVGTGLELVPAGLAKMIVGISFSLGLVLVIVGGAELFTGNNMIVMACAGGRVSVKQLLQNWAVVYLGNFVGSVCTAVLVYFSLTDAAVARKALAIAHYKVSIPFQQAFVSGILCNALVCLAIWLTFSARTTTGKVLVIVPPVTAFVASGFEHCIANMYFIPMGLLLQSEMKSESALNWLSFVTSNLVPVTAGNIVGGSLLVAATYWFIYLRVGRS